MSEFSVSYNKLNNLKQGEFNTYTSYLCNAYNSLDSMYTEIKSNIYLWTIWNNIIKDYDNVIKMRDSIDDWLSNYIENIKRIENCLPDTSVDANQAVSTTKYYKDHSNYTYIG